jgi:ATP-binding cassette subfamily B protein
VLGGGAIVDQGTHHDLLDRCDLYRRIFAHYDQPAREGEPLAPAPVAER